jgi:DNA-binding transcriptional LysR family regulator
MLLRRDVDLAITSTPDNLPESLLALPFQQWQLTVVTPPGHALHDQPLTLENLAAWPLVTYDQMLPVRAHLNRAFDRRGLATNIAISAMDSATIITYVKLGLGVGVVSEAALPEKPDPELQIASARELFNPVANNICLHKQRMYPAFVFRLINLIAPALTPEQVQALLYEI